MTDLPDRFIPDDSQTLGRDCTPWDTEPATVPPNWRVMGFRPVPETDAIECQRCSKPVVAKKPLESAPWIDDTIAAWRCSSCFELHYSVNGDSDVPITDAIDEAFEIEVALAHPGANQRVWQTGEDRR